MPPRVSSPLVEVFLLVEQPRQRLSHWTQALALLDDPDAPAVASVDAYYDPAASLAIFGLRYDELALGADGLKRMVELAVLTEIGMIQPAELSEGDRRRFVGERLARCTEHVRDQRKIVGALVELVRRVRGHKASAPRAAAMPPPLPGAARGARGTRRADDAAGLAERPLAEPDNSLLVLAAKGTRTVGAEPALPQGTRDLARGSVRQAKIVMPGPPAAAPAAPVMPAMLDPAVADARAIPEAELTHVVSEPIAIPRPVPAAATVPMRGPARGPAAIPALYPDASTGPVTGTSSWTVTEAGPVTEASPVAEALPPSRRAASPSPNVVARGGVHRANTVMMSPLETQRMLEAANATQPVPLVSAELMAAMMADGEADGETGGSADPAGEISADDPAAARTATYGVEPAYGDGIASLPPVEPGAIYARYLRSGRWIPIRIGALSLKGATLLSGALPRIADRVDISLLYGNHRALVRGTVAKLSTREEAVASGATAFTVSFELEDASRRQLTALLTAARAARVTLKPPPPRSTQRFPVEWPVCLGTVRGAVRAEALDVSTDGMFVKPLHALTLEADVTFTSVLDDALSPVSGHARIVRSINDLEARTAGLSPGYGIHIVDMPEHHRERWDAFLGRVERRTAKRVLIGASPARLAELQAGLVAAGYTATGGSDPGAIAQLASAEALPVDAALIDASWLAASGSPSWVEALLAARNVPCVTMHGDARRARTAIDRLLSVV